MTLDPRAVACALGGSASGRNVLAPGLGHSRSTTRSRSRSSPPPRTASSHSFAGDSPLECRDYVRAALGLGARERRRLLAGKRAARTRARDTHTCECCGKFSSPGVRIRSSAAAAASSKPTDSALRIFPLRPESETPNVTGNGSEAPRWDKSRNGGEA
jgi:hypothetical protein